MLAQFANITQMDPAYYSNLASAIVDLGNNYATTEQKITEMSQGIAASASLAGMSEADMVALSAAVTSLGIETQAGSTSMGITSGWLYVLQHYQAGVYVDPDGEHTHTITDTYTGGGSASTKPDHDHAGTHLTYWMPKVNDRVLVLYLPVFNGDGFVLGGI